MKIVIQKAIIDAIESFNKKIKEQFIIGKFYVVMKAPKNDVSILISELEKDFSAKILDWKPIAEPTANNAYFFSVTVTDNLDKKLEAYCNSKFLRNNEKPDEYKPTGKIYDVS